MSNGGWSIYEVSATITFTDDLEREVETTQTVLIEPGSDATSAIDRFKSAMMEGQHDWGKDDETNEKISIEFLSVKNVKLLAEADIAPEGFGDIGFDLEDDDEDE